MQGCFGPIVCWIWLISHRDPNTLIVCNWHVPATRARYKASLVRPVPQQLTELLLHPALPPLPAFTPAHRTPPQCAAPPSSSSPPSPPSLPLASTAGRTQPTPVRSAPYSAHPITPILTAARLCTSLLPALPPGRRLRHLRPPRRRVSLQEQRLHQQHHHLHRRRLLGQRPPAGRGRRTECLRSSGKHPVPSSCSSLLTFILP